MFDALLSSLAALMTLLGACAPVLEAGDGELAPRPAAVATPAAEPSVAPSSVAPVAEPSVAPTSVVPAEPSVAPSTVAPAGAPAPDVAAHGPAPEPGDAVVATAPLPAIGTIRIAEIGIERRVFDAAGSDGAEIQALIDSCQGAVLYYRYADKVSVIGAHRSKCGDAGFSGVELLGPGSSVTMDTGDRSTSFSWVGSLQATVGGQMSDMIAQLDADFEGIALQTSLSSSVVVFQFFERQ